MFFPLSGVFKPQHRTLKRVQGEESKILPGLESDDSRTEVRRSPIRRNLREKTYDEFKVDGAQGCSPNLEVYLSLRSPARK